MRITSKGQVTIPQDIREEAGLWPTVEVEFTLVKDGVLIKKSRGQKTFGVNLIEHMRGRADTKMTTDQIMALTRK